MESSSYSGTSKRAKAPVNVTQVAHCLVDGCNADLSLCRDYHRRHKVCETHSKTPKVTIGGREQRFCQQCSRFHSLVEFDEGKRSCRKRLDGHNRRRRKPQQPDPLPRNSGILFSTPPGVSCSRLLSFSSPQILPSTAMSSSWNRAIKPENDIVLNNNHQHLNYNQRQNSFPECSSHNYKGSVHQLHFSDNPFLDPNATSRTCNGSQKLYSDGLNQVVDSNRALSLLSSASALPQSQSLVHNLHYGGIGPYPFTQENKAVIPTLNSEGNDSSTLHFPEMLHHGQEGSSTTGSHQTLTFTWE